MKIIWLALLLAAVSVSAQTFSLLGDSLNSNYYTRSIALKNNTHEEITIDTIIFKMLDNDELPWLTYENIVNTRLYLSISTGGGNGKTYDFSNKTFYADTSFYSQLYEENPVKIGPDSTDTVGGFGAYLETPPPGYTYVPYVGRIASIIFKSGTASDTLTVCGAFAGNVAIQKRNNFRTRQESVGPASRTLDLQGREMPQLPAQGLNGVLIRRHDATAHTAVR